ncbi:MAG: PhoH family protein [Flavobacteriales bacterium]|nr:PhoH family protein [Flavobacteriales bacterium]MBQ5814471.1 PhoH family protein [Flavobacteriales bacterium]
MTQKTENKRIIEITEVSPIEFFGENNSKLTTIASYFPKLKIVGRGSSIIAMGESEVLDTFEKSVMRLVSYLHRYNSLSPMVIERLLTGDDMGQKKDDVILYGAYGQGIKANTANQSLIVSGIEDNDMLFAIGPAGTGKTYTSVAMAVKALKNKEVRRIILTRPAVEAGENLGFLPGDLKEKLDPYMMPLYDALRDMIHGDKLSSLMEKGVIQIAPLAFMRGRTLDNAFVILDEAQNTTPMQMKMFLTRMGRGSKFIITGDPGQTDLPTRQKSGLGEAIHLLSGMEGIAFVYLGDEDVIRHPLVKNIINAYKKTENK